MKNFLSKQRLLVIAPHADDETSGAGGLIWRIKQAGGTVFVMVVSVGNLDHYDERNEQVPGSVRGKELADAMAVLGVDDFEILYEDEELHLRLDSIPRRDLINKFEREGKLATDKTEPTMIVLPAPSFNQDHEAVFKAGITACRPHLATMKSFQNCVLVADAPQLAWNTSVFKPNLYVNISGEGLAKKLEAFACHKTQMRPEPHQGGIGAVEMLARSRGREISVEAAEAYEGMRFVI
jgi:LmbE family N-acetylglucosaminyl deacetylase